MQKCNSFAKVKKCSGLEIFKKIAKNVVFALMFKKQKNESIFLYYY